VIASELARLADLSEATVSRLISGERRPSVETMAELKRLLGWSLDEQVDALAGGTFGSELADRMERQPTA